MKLSSGVVVLYWVCFILFDLLLKSSGFEPFSHVETLVILFIVFSVFSTSWRITFLYLIVSFFSDTINYQIIGLTACSVFFAYQVCVLVNKFINIAKEHKLIFALLILNLAFLLRYLLSVIFFAIYSPINLIILLVNSFILVVVYIFINKLNSESVFKR